MNTVSFTEFRNNLSHYLDSAEDDSEEIIVNRSKNRKSVLVSYAEYSSLLETAYLLSSPNNRAHLERSLQEAAKGKTVTVDW